MNTNSKENTNNNFKWLTSDIFESLAIKAISKTNPKVYSFNSCQILKMTGEEFDIKSNNIDDLTNLLTVGIVRFTDINKTILDIPLRNLYLLYEKGNFISLDIDDIYLTNQGITPKELEAYLTVNGREINENYRVIPYIINKIPEDLAKFLSIAAKYLTANMQEQFDSLSEINLINYRRLKTFNS